MEVMTGDVGTTHGALLRQSSHSAVEAAERAQTWTKYVPGAVGVHGEAVATPYSLRMVHVPAVSLRSQNRYCTGAVPPVAVALHNLAVPMLTGHAGPMATPVRCSTDPCAVTMAYSNTNSRETRPAPRMLCRSGRDGVEGVAIGVMIG